jgi:hypothetical protein
MNKPEEQWMVSDYDSRFGTRDDAAETFLVSTDEADFGNDREGFMGAPDPIHSQWMVLGTWEEVEDE